MLDGYWQNRPSEPVVERLMGTWMDELEAFSPDEIQTACRRWTRENPRRKPNFGDIVGLLRDRRREACKPFIADISRIVREVADRCGVPEWKLRGHGRPNDVCDARAEAMALCRDLGASEPMIGEFFGGRDHTTVRAALDRWEKIKDRRQPAAINDDQRAEAERIMAGFAGTRTA